MKKLLSFTFFLLLASVGLAAIYPGTYVDPRIDYVDKGVISNEEWTLLYNNCPLKNVTGIKGHFWCLHTNQPYPWRFECEGGPNITPTAEGVYNWEWVSDEDGTVTAATCEFQGRWAGSYLMTATLTLKQEGTAVYAQVTSTAYPYNQKYGYKSTGYVGQYGTAYILDLSTQDRATRPHTMVQVSVHNVELEFVADGATRRVIFYDNNGNILSEQKVEFGTAATAPESVPDVEGYDFIGWDKDFSNVRDDLYIYPHYEKSYFDVTFIGIDGETVIEKKQVKRTTDAEAPEAPAEEGYVFSSWEGDLTNVTEDRTIYAKYLKLYKVTFLGFEDAELLVTNVAETCDAVAPAAPEVEGYKFYQWSGDYTNISGETTITAQYHKLFKVVFQDQDGTVLSEQMVEETCAAEEPNNLVGKTGWLGWDTEDFKNVTSELTVTAVYGEAAPEVKAATETGLLEGEENVLIYCGVSQGANSWNATTKNWATAGGVYSTWKSGATAVFARDAEVAVDEGVTLGKVILLGAAKKVTLTGEQAVTFVAPATVQFNVADAAIRFANEIAGAAGLVVTGAVEAVTEGVPSSALEIAGNDAITGTHTIARALFKTVEEGTLGSGTFAQALAIKESGVVSLGSTAAQTMKGQIDVAKKGQGYVITEPGSAVDFCSDKGSNWELRIAGKTSASKYNTLPGAGGGKTHVLAGGELVMGSFNGYWGPQVWTDVDGVTVYTNGLLRFTKTDSSGVIMGYTINGGTVTNDVAKGDNILYEWYLKNGARMMGYGMRVGFTTYYNKWSFINAGGETPSYVDLDAIEIGYQNSAGNNTYVGIQFQVNDVTGDDATDLYVSSPITEVKSGLKYSEGCRGNVGVYKQGAGTLELSAANSCCTTGVFKVEAGTVRFPAKSGGAFGALQVTGDGVLEVASSARITFDDSSEIAWTAGKKLVFTGDMSARSVRIGTSADALTAEQLAAIVYRKANGKEVAMTLNADGYLLPPAKSLTIIIQ